MSELIRVVGLDELQSKLRGEQWAKEPARRFLLKWALATQRQTVANFKRGKEGGWIDTGGTRQSVTNVVDTSNFPVYAQVGSNLDKFRWGEYGTGTLSEDPASSHRRYFPPPSALEAWARKHGMTGGQVAYGIWRKGGTEPRRYLRDAFKETDGRIPGWLAEMAGDIERAASAGVE